MTRFPYDLRQYPNFAFSSVQDHLDKKVNYLGITGFENISIGQERVIKYNSVVEVKAKYQFYE